jgi:hypothetical protein
MYNKFKLGEVYHHVEIELKTSRSVGIFFTFFEISYTLSGTRFNARGVDDDGNVANFVEVLNSKDTQCSYLFSNS